MAEMLDETVRDEDLTDAVFEMAPRDAPDEDSALEISVDGFEGPLDLLLTLARGQKVDLARISVLQLAEQYLAFVERARVLRIELAADYLVMAAWLAYLKSRLLLPKDESDDGPTGDEMAAHLAFQLERLEAMRRVAAQLMARDQLGRDFFARGMSESVTVRRQTTWAASLSELLRAYARVRTREEYSPLKIDPTEVMPVEAALERLKGLIGDMLDWATLSSYLPEGWDVAPARRRSSMASSFVAVLELARRGDVELRQEGAFAPIYLRRRGAAAAR